MRALTTFDIYKEDGIFIAKVLLKDEEYMNMPLGDTADKAYKMAKRMITNLSNDFDLVYAIAYIGLTDDERKILKKLDELN